MNNDGSITKFDSDGNSLPSDDPKDAIFAEIEQKLVKSSYGNQFKQMRNSSPALFRQSALSGKFDDYLNGYKKGGVVGLGPIKGKGTGTSDSIATDLPIGNAIIPADVVKQYGVDFFNKLRELCPDNEQNEDEGEVIPAKVSNGEFHFSADEVKFLGKDFIYKLINGGENSKEERGEYGKGEMDDEDSEGEYADGGIADDRKPLFTANPKPQAIGMQNGMPNYGSGDRYQEPPNKVSDIGGDLEPIPGYVKGGIPEDDLLARLANPRPIAPELRATIDANNYTPPTQLQQKLNNPSVSANAAEKAAAMRQGLGNKVNLPPQPTEPLSQKIINPTINSNAAEQAANMRQELASKPSLSPRQVEPLNQRIIDPAINANASEQAATVRQKIGSNAVANNISQQNVNNPSQNPLGVKARIEEVTGISGNRQASMPLSAEGAKTQSFIKGLNLSPNVVDVNTVRNAANQFVNQENPRHPEYTDKLNNMFPKPEEPALSKYINEYKGLGFAPSIEKAFTDVSNVIGGTKGVAAKSLGSNGNTVGFQSSKGLTEEDKKKLTPEQLAGAKNYAPGAYELSGDVVAKGFDEKGQMINVDKNGKTWVNNGSYINGKHYKPDGTIEEYNPKAEQDKSPAKQAEPYINFNGKDYASRNDFLASQAAAKLSDTDLSTLLTDRGGAGGKLGQQPQQPARQSLAPSNQSDASGYTKEWDAFEKARQKIEPYYSLGQAYPMGIQPGARPPDARLPRVMGFHGESRDGKGIHELTVDGMTALASLNRATNDSRKDVADLDLRRDALSENKRQYDTVSASDKEKNSIDSQKRDAEILAKTLNEQKKEDRYYAPQVEIDGDGNRKVKQRQRTGQKGNSFDTDVELNSALNDLNPKDPLYERKYTAIVSAWRSQNQGN